MTPHIKLNKPFSIRSFLCPHCPGQIKNRIETEKYKWKRLYCNHCRSYISREDILERLVPPTPIGIISEKQGEDLNANTPQLPGE